MLSNQVQCQLVLALQAVQLNRRPEAEDSNEIMNDCKHSSQINKCLCNFGTNERIEFKNHYFFDCPLPMSKVLSFKQLCKIKEDNHARKNEKISR